MQLSARLRGRESYNAEDAEKNSNRKAREGRKELLVRSQMSPEMVEALCSKCGEVFTMFLQEMADKNEKVVCPRCAAELECGMALPAEGSGKN